MNKRNSTSGLWKGMALGAMVATAVTIAITNKKDVSKKAKEALINLKEIKDIVRFYFDQIIKEMKEIAEIWKSNSSSQVSGFVSGYKVLSKTKDEDGFFEVELSVDIEKYNAFNALSKRITGYVEFDLGELVKRCQEKVLPQYEKKEQQVECFVTANVPLVYADKSGIERVIINILTN